MMPHHRSNHGRNLATCAATIALISTTITHVVSTSHYNQHHLHGEGGGLHSSERESNLFIPRGGAWGRRSKSSPIPPSPKLETNTETPPPRPCLGTSRGSLSLDDDDKIPSPLQPPSPPSSTTTTTNSYAKSSSQKPASEPIKSSSKSKLAAATPVKKTARSKKTNKPLPQSKSPQPSPSKPPAKQEEKGEKPYPPIPPPPPPTTKKTTQKRSKSPPLPTNLKDFYTLLNLSQSSAPTLSQITRGYRKACLLYHPDKYKGAKNGSRVVFDAVAEAYECLKDEGSRGAYDDFGYDGWRRFKDGGGSGSGGGNGSTNGGGVSSEQAFMNAFSNTNNRQNTNGFNFAMPKRRMKCRDIQFALTITLTELYLGCTKSLKIQKPSKYQAGFGERERMENKDVKVEIERGFNTYNAEGGGVRLKGVVDHLVDVGVEAGDCVFIIQIDEAENSNGMVEIKLPQKQRRSMGFKRIPNTPHLKIAINLTLVEALTGFRKTIVHLDDRVIQLVNKPSDRYIKDCEVRVVRGEGMPLPGPEGRFGDLYVEFYVGDREDIGIDVKKEIRGVFKVEEFEDDDADDASANADCVKLEDVETGGGSGTGTGTGTGSGSGYDGWFNQQAREQQRDQKGGEQECSQM